jgi:HEAT repeat protein
MSAPTAESHEELEVKTCLAQVTARYEGTRWQAVSCLSQYVKDDSVARRAVIRALRDPDVDVREAAAGALGPAGTEAIPGLVRALGDKGRVVHSAASSLGQIGPDAIPALVEAFPKYGLGVAYAMARIGPPALPELIRALEDPIVRGPAVAGIETMGPSAAPAVPALTVLLKYPNPGMRSIALRALAAIGEEATEAIPALMVALDDPVGYVRVGAAGTLAAIGPGAAAAVPKLWAMAQNSNLDRQLRLNCDIAVRKIQGRK